MADLGMHLKLLRLLVKMIKISFIFIGIFLFISAMWQLNSSWTRKGTSNPKTYFEFM